mgnify:CR=1 FL=1
MVLTMGDMIPYGHEVIDVTSTKWKLDITDGKLYQQRSKDLLLAGTVVETIDEGIIVTTNVNVPVKVIRETIEVYKRYV